VRIYLTISVGEHDHPGVSVEEDVVDGETVRTATVHLAEGVTVIGPPEAVKAWADGISMRASLL
jgi:hypothetical protein